MGVSDREVGWYVVKGGHGQTNQFRVSKIRSNNVCVCECVCECVCVHVCECVCVCVCVCVYVHII